MPPAGLNDALSQQDIMPSAHTNTAPQGDRAGPWGPGVWGRLAAALVHGIQVLPGMILPPHTWRGTAGIRCGAPLQGRRGARGARRRRPVRGARRAPRACRIQALTVVMLAVLK